MLIFFTDLTMAFYQSFLRTHLHPPHVDASSSSDSVVTPNHFTDGFSDSSPATSFELPECSPLRWTMAEVNMRDDTDTERKSEDPESQTSISSSSFDRRQQEAYQSLASSQDMQSQPQEPLELTVTAPWEDIASSQACTSIRGPSLLFGSGSSTFELAQHHQQDDPTENNVYPMADFAMSHQKRVLNAIAEDEAEERQSPHKRPRGDQDASEYDADRDEEEPSGEFQCPHCSHSYKHRRTLVRHRRSISQLKCLDLTAGPLNVYSCSVDHCAESSCRLDVIKRHVKRIHKRTWEVSDKTRKAYTVERLQEMMAREN